MLIVANVLRFGAVALLGTVINFIGPLSLQICRDGLRCATFCNLLTGHIFSHCDACSPEVHLHHRRHSVQTCSDFQEWQLSPLRLVAPRPGGGGGGWTACTRTFCDEVAVGYLQLTAMHPNASPVVPVATCRLQAASGCICRLFPDITLVAFFASHPLAADSRNDVGKNCSTAEAMYVACGYVVARLCMNVFELAVDTMLQ